VDCDGLSNAKLEAEFSANKEAVFTFVNTVLQFTYDYDLDKMRQTNTKTGTIRKLERILESHTKDDKEAKISHWLTPQSDAERACLKLLVDPQFDAIHPDSFEKGVPAVPP
jgi:hypothetical protein